MVFRSTALVSLLIATHRANAQTFKLTDSFVGDSFLSGFSWGTSDPSGGHVNYVDQNTALQKNLTYASSDGFVIRADYQNVVPSSAPGRDSVRITSNNAYTDSVIVLDVQHMPGGCAQWPAFWTYAVNNWPNGGEVDIIEGINLQSNNQASLHTSAGCTMPPNRSQRGTAGPNDCNVDAGDNSGCQTYFTPSTFGAPLNGGGGGWFVMARSASDGVAMYFWGRNDPDVPTAIRKGQNSINPSDAWGEPEARFPTTASCDFNSHFSAHNMVINLSFCGPWGGKKFASAGCGPGTCEDYVNNNPQDFVDAYWEINALRVYTP